MKLPLAFSWQWLLLENSTQPSSRNQPSSIHKIHKIIFFKIWSSPYKCPYKPQVITDNLKSGTKIILSNEVSEIGFLKIPLDGFSRAIKIMSEWLDKQHWIILSVCYNAELGNEFKVAGEHWGYSLKKSKYLFDSTSKKKVNTILIWETMQPM